MNWFSLSPGEWFGAGAMVAYAGLLAWKARSAFAYLRSEEEAFGSGKGRGGLTVLQPILSGDPTLARCLRASADLARGDTRFVWLVDEDDDEAKRVASELERPGVQIRPMAPAPPGVNPKVHKLALALEDVDTEFVAVLDDDTTVGVRHLDRARQVLQSDRCRGGIYTGLPTYRAEPPSVGGNLLAAFVNSSSALTYLPPAHSGPPITINGMFYATRASDLRSVGGFSAIADQLCDDLALARLYRNAGRPIHQGAMAQLLFTGPVGLGGYLQRMHRWFLFARVLLRGQSGSHRMRLMASLGAAPILLWSALAGALVSRPLTVAFAFLLVVRFWTLSALLSATRETQAREEGSSAPEAELFPISSIVTELLQPLHFVHALLVPEIRWRSHRMRARADGGFDSLPR